MENEKYILVREFCTHHKLQPSFIKSLKEYGLIEVVFLEEDEYIEKEQVVVLEKMKRLHYDLEINLEGIDAINHLLGRISSLQQEVQKLRNRLSRYEEQS